MSNVKRYDLKRRRYIAIRNQNSLSYGGSQEWFPKEVGTAKEWTMHEYGCGVVAVADLFLYWATTLKNGEETWAAQYIEKYGTLTKETYMTYLKEVRERYVTIFPPLGTFGFQLSMVINRYAKENHIPYEANLDLSLNDLTMLKRMEEMLEHNLPIILMIGISMPMIPGFLSHGRKKKGLPFYTQKPPIMPVGKQYQKPYARYELAKKGVFSHFVVITGIIVDEQAENASEHIMLKISSWGNEYYVSYHHLRYYINEISSPFLSAIISLKER